MISVTILTKNSEKHLEDVLKQLQRFDEVTILDTGSTDSTLSIAQQFPNVTIYKSAFEGFGPAHNLLSSKAKHDWILSIDSDEILEEALIDEILDLSLEPKSVYSFRRKNFYKGVFVRGCGWWPDRVVRLYNRCHTSFTNAHVHEAVITDGMRIIPLEACAHHFPYTSVHDFLNKMQSYSTLFAHQMRGKKRSSTTKATAHALFAFVRSYLFKRGFLLGGVGLEISLYNANCTFYKYLKLKEINSTLYTGRG